MMKYIKYIGIILLIFVLAIIALTALAMRPSIETYFIESSEMTYLDALQLLDENDSLEKKINSGSDSNIEHGLGNKIDRNCVEILLGGHQLKRGDKIVFQYYRNEPGELFVMDTGSFQFLTIEMSKDLLGKPLGINSADVRYYYTRGGTHWVHRCGGSVAYNASGTVTIHQINSEKIEAVLDISLEKMSTRTREKMGTETIRGTFIAKKSPRLIISENPYSRWIRIVNGS